MIRKGKNGQKHIYFKVVKNILKQNLISEHYEQSEMRLGENSICKSKILGKKPSQERERLAVCTQIYEVLLRDWRGKQTEAIQSRGLPFQADWIERSLGG